MIYNHLRSWRGIVPSVRFETICSQNTVKTYFRCSLFGFSAERTVNEQLYWRQSSHYSSRTPSLTNSQRTN